MLEKGSVLIFAFVFGSSGCFMSFGKKRTFAVLCISGCFGPVCFLTTPQCYQAFHFLWWVCVARNVRITDISHENPYVHKQLGYCMPFPWFRREFWTWNLCFPFHTTPGPFCGLFLHHGSCLLISLPSENKCILWGKFSDEGNGGRLQGTLLPC